jgi:hypothetical protein
MRYYLLLVLLFTFHFSSGQVGTHLELLVQHEGFVGDVNLTGYSTYRLYITLPNESDVGYLMWGDEDFPLEINSDSSFFQSVFGGATSENINPSFIEFFPALQYDSFIGLGFDDNAGPFLYAIDTYDTWGAPFEAGGNLQMTDSIGGAIFYMVNYNYELQDPESNNLFVGQFTTKGNLWGTLNIDYMSEFEMFQPYTDPVAAIGLEFGSESGLVFGCTDPLAINYLPEADVLTDCQYVVGDLTFDGEVNIDDLLILLGGIGCIDDCGILDVNDDGIVNIIDLLIFLGLL